MKTRKYTKRNKEYWQKERVKKTRNIDDLFKELEADRKDKERVRWKMAFLKAYKEVEDSRSDVSKAQAKLKSLREKYESGAEAPQNQSADVNHFYETFMRSYWT